MTEPLDDARGELLALADEIDFCPENSKDEGLPFSLDRHQREMIVAALRRAAPVPRCEAEPVAWLCHDLIVQCESIITKKELAAQRKARPDDWRVEPLYTAPPSRSEAVTADDILSEIVEHWNELKGTVTE